MFKCICGREFGKELSLYAHQSHCRDYLGEEKYRARLEKARASGQKGSNNAHLKALNRKQIDLEKWVAEQHVCEKCGKIMTERFGSGVYCSKRCASSRTHSEEQRDRIRRSVLDSRKRPEVIAKLCACRNRIVLCEICGKSIYKSGYNNHLKKHNRKVIVGCTYNKNRVVLDITNWELEQYRKSHPVCEMCGKAETRRGASKLCIDHDHTTGHFRGLLCFKCNTNLGNYENQRKTFENYLKSKKGV